MYRKSILWVLLIAMICFVHMPIARAQEETNSASSHEAKAVSYRLDFSINELENGKKVNTRHYSTIETEDMSMGFPGFTNLKIGSRVPIESGDNQFQYLDIGTNIGSRLYMKLDALTIDVHAEVSNIAPPDEESDSKQPLVSQSAKVNQPLIRQMVISGSTIIIPGKPVIIGSVADPNSNREFQLEVTATKIE